MTNFDYTSKVAALLAKAAGTSNEDEAATYRAKASELMLKMQIDEADVARAGKQQTPEQIITRVVIGLKKGAFAIKARREIIYWIARLFNVRTTIASNRSYVQLYGYESDVMFVQALFSSLTMQLDMLLGHMAGDRSFKTSFAHGFARRVGERMQLSRKGQESEAETSTPGTAIMLRDRKADVDTWFSGNVQTRGSSYKNTSIRSGAGYMAGDAAGARADLGGGKLTAGDRKSIG